MNRILCHPEDNRLLRRKAKRVTNPQATEAVLCVQTMKRLALEWEQRHPGQLCAGLAAPQIGVNLRIVIVRSQDEERAPQDPFMLTDEQVLEIYGDIESDEEARRVYFEAIATHEAWKRTAGASYDPFRVMYNPVYVESDGMQDSEEGCLSVPHAEGVTLRPEKSTFHFYDHCMRRQPPSGDYMAQGFASAVICHEMDHLSGILYIDSAYKLWRPGSKKEFLAKQAAETEAA